VTRVGRRVSVVSIVLMFLLLGTVVVCASLPVKKTVKVMIHVPPMQRIQIEESRPCFWYEGQALELSGVARVRVESNTAWQLEVGAKPLTDGTVPRIVREGDLDNGPGVHVITYDAIIPASDRLAKGKHELDLFFQLSSL